jgi:hypothetical protein
MSALHSRESFTALDYLWRARSLARVGRQFASTKAVVQCGFDPCGACTIEFDDGVFLLARGVSGKLVTAPRGSLSFSLAEAPHPHIPLAVLPTRRRGYPRRGTVGCSRFRTMGRRSDDCCKGANEASHTRHLASLPC